MSEYPPSHGESAFNCAMCDVYAKQVWYDVQGRRSVPGAQIAIIQRPEFELSHCDHCGGAAVWHGSALVYPTGVRMGTNAPDATPDNVRKIYDEARDVSASSPRAAAALLRLALQVLVDELEPGTAQLNDKIGALVKRGLDDGVRKAMDALRVIGNNAVHPGSIEVSEDETVVPGLFALLLLVVDQMIVRPQEVDRLYDLLPDGAVAAIERRDGS